MGQVKPRNSSADACLYVIFRIPVQEHGKFLTGWLRPLAFELAEDPLLRSLFFIRYDDRVGPHIRFRVLGDERWIERKVRPFVFRRMEDLKRGDSPVSYECGTYEPELKRYGGPVGLALAERVFFHDSLACLDLIDLDQKGALDRSLEEVFILLSESLLRSLGLSLAERVKVHELRTEVGLQLKKTQPESLRRQIDLLRKDLGPAMGRPETAWTEADWGGVEAKRAAKRWVRGLRPAFRDLKKGLSSGEIDQDLMDLAGSFLHMESNRLGFSLRTEWCLHYLMMQLLRSAS